MDWTTDRRTQRKHFDKERIVFRHHESSSGDFEKKQFPDIQELQATENTPVSYDNNNMGKYHFKFQRATSLAAQIYHNRKFHWVASAKVDCQIYVFDSLFNSSLSPSLQMQLASIYGGDFKQLTIRVPSIQQQTNNVDCGLFPSANLVQFCIGYYVGKQLIKFDEEYLGEHMVSCLENGRFTPFPRLETKAKLNKKKTVV